MNTGPAILLNQTPQLDISSLLESVPFWLTALASAVSKGDEPSQIQCQQALHDLGWVVLSPSQVQALNEPEDRPRRTASRDKPSNH